MSNESRRTFLRKTGSILGVAAIGGVAAACGGNGGGEQGAGNSAQESTAETDSKTVTIEPVDNQMQYATTEIQAPAGSELTIVFNNTATSPAMNHNVVVLKNEEGVKETVGQAAMMAKENDFIPPEHENLIIAHTPMSAPGETVEVTFTVPPAGEYPFICTYPGHWNSMQGTLIAQ